jgi:hypothetical protein
MIVDFLKDLLFAYLKLHTIIIIYHQFVLDFHGILLLGAKMLAEKDLSKGAFAYEVQYLVTLDYLCGGVAHVKEEIIGDAAEVRALVSVGGSVRYGMTCPCCCVYR